jgi:hypothetical protein
LSGMDSCLLEWILVRVSTCGWTELKIDLVGASLSKDGGRYLEREIYH